MARQPRNATVPAILTEPEVVIAREQPTAQTVDPPKHLLTLGAECRVAYRNLERVKAMGADAKRNLPDAATCAKIYDAACAVLKAAGGDPFDWR